MTPIEPSARDVLPGGALERGAIAAHARPELAGGGAIAAATTSETADGPGPEAGGRASAAAKAFDAMVGQDRPPAPGAAP